jgi:tRNA nucleotidyltransferase/poly(A) polymerase
MKIYMVGGAVRDVVLPVQDRDCGIANARLLAQGYLPVGRDFWCFGTLSTREYAGAHRTQERRGYRSPAPRPTLA